MFTERPYQRFRYMDALYRLLDEYHAAIEDSGLSPDSQRDYKYFSECFVRWLHNDYTPGQGLS